MQAFFTGIAILAGVVLGIIIRSVSMKREIALLEQRTRESLEALSTMQKQLAQGVFPAFPRRIFLDATRTQTVTLRVQAIARSPRPSIKRAPLAGADSRDALISKHRIFEEGRWRAAALFDRAWLRPGNRITGPAVIVELSATTWLPTGWIASVDAFNSLVLTPRQGVRR